MILEKKITKKVNKYVLWRYKEKYECIAGDIIEIPISDLSKSSHEKIKVKCKEKEKVYHPDFYLPEFDLIVEIKSSWWLKQHKDRCIAKEDQTKKNHNYIMVLDKNYTDLDFIPKFIYTT